MNNIQTPVVTVIFPLFHAEIFIADLLRSLETQQHPLYVNQSDWLEAIFIDNCSQDNTLAILNEELIRLGRTSNYRVIENKSNLGLAGSLNRAISQVTTPIIVTCHSDCRFGTSTFVYSAIMLLDRFPDAAAISGVPAMDESRSLSFVEKLNIISNLIELAPPNVDKTVRSVAFPEGRCDAFRTDALRAAGCYPTTLRLAGEDQILAGKLRNLGFTILQSAELKFYIALSIQQDSVFRLITHQMRYGRAHVFILALSPSSFVAPVKNSGGDNRRARFKLRALQIFSTIINLLGITLILATSNTFLGSAMIIATFCFKLLFLHTYLLKTQLGLRELLAILALQPLFDICYTVGVLQGATALFRSRFVEENVREIS